MPRFTTFESLGNRDFRLLWQAQVASSMAQWMDQVTRGWLILTLTNSPLQLGVAMAARGLPILFFGLIAGAFADRYGRKQVLVLAKVVNVLAALVLATLVFTGLVQPWHVYVTAFAAGIGQAFQQPARQTLISDLVGDDRLLNAIALNSAALNASRVVGPAIAGWVIVLVGFDGAYFLEAGVYVVATIWTLQMYVPDRATDGRPRESFFRSIGTGFAFASHDGNIRSLLLLALGPLTFGMAYTTLMPVIARDVLGGGPELSGVLLSFIGGGSLLGALVVASVRRSHAYALPMVVGAAMFSISIAAFASSPWVWLSCVLGALLGLSNVTYTTQNQTLLQVMSPDHLRGRVMSIYLLDRGLVPMGALLAGALASQFGGPTALRTMAAISLAIVCLVVASRPGLLRLKVPL
ncbi:MAG: MFS transporter, partial [Dehalococcoidia bacterium]